jgi:hypothetical protein
MDPGRTLDVDVVLAPSDPTGLSALLASLHDPASAGYHHWLTAATFDRAFGPPPTAVESVTSWLDGAGLHHDPAAGSMVAVHAPAGRLSATLGVSLRRYGLRDGHEVFTALGAPAIPASVASNVIALIGLDNVAAATPDIAKPHRTKGTAGSRPRIAGYNPPCSAALAYANSNGWYTNDEVGAAYGIGALVSSGQTGAGVTVAVPELAAYSPTDVSAYTGCFGLAESAASVLVDGGAPPDSSGGTAEADGDAGFYGSTGAIRLNRPVVAMAATPSGKGYWLVAADGGIFTFGDAGFYGSTGAIRLNQPVVGMTAGPAGDGYRLVAADGGIFTFGTAPFYGSLGDNPPPLPITAMTASVDGYGYYMTSANGAVYAIGDAPYLGRAIPN